MSERKVRYYTVVIVYQEPAYRLGIPWSVLPENAYFSGRKILCFSLTHAIWDSCGDLGGRPRRITVCCRGVQSLESSDQLSPTISINVSTAKVRRPEKCGGIRGARVTTDWDTSGTLT